MKRKLLNIFIILALTLSLTATAFAQSAEADSLQANNGEAKSYIVVMKQSPAIAYEGEIDDLAATKPGTGGKINPNSAHVRKYQAYLEAQQNVSLEAAGASTDQKINSYTVALNGYSAILTESQAKDIEGQADVVLVLVDHERAS